MEFDEFEIFNEYCPAYWWALRQAKTVGLSEKGKARVDKIYAKWIYETPKRRTP